jgi:hypothetical protein
VLVNQGVTKRCRLSWLTNSALVYEPKCGGRGVVAGSQAMSIQLCIWSPYKLGRSNLYVVVNPWRRAAAMCVRKLIYRFSCADRFGSLLVLKSDGGVKV